MSSPCPGPISMIASPLWISSAAAMDRRTAVVFKKMLSELLHINTVYFYCNVRKAYQEHRGGGDILFAGGVRIHGNNFHPLLFGKSLQSFAELSRRAGCDDACSLCALLCGGVPFDDARPPDICSRYKKDLEGRTISPAGHVVAAAHGSGHFRTERDIQWRTSSQAAERYGWTFGRSADRRCLAALLQG